MKEARHKRTYIVRFHLYEISRIGKPIDAEGRLAFAGAVGGGKNGEQLLKGGVSFGVRKMSWN